MTTSELIEKYSNNHLNLMKEGKQNKRILISLLLPLLVIDFLFFEAIFNVSVEDKFTLKDPILIFSLSAAIIWVTSVSVISPLKLLSRKKIRKMRNAFKADLFSSIYENIPEITDYYHHDKIAQAIFFSSGLFSKKSARYNGDDWLEGFYKEVKFEICELHVTRFFKTVFSGIFIRIRISDNMVPVELKNLNILLSKQMEAFTSKHKAPIRLSLNQESLFICVQRDDYFFESFDIELIKKLNDDIHLLKELVEIVKRAIDIQTKQQP